MRATVSVPPVVMLVAKGFQRPDIPRARQEADALIEAGYSVHIIAWDRNQEFPPLETVGEITVRSLHPLNLRKFSKFGLALGGILFDILLIFETVGLIIRLRQRPIVHAHDINTLPIACLLRSLGLCSALVYDCREFTYGLYYDWFNSLVASLMRVIEERCLPCADAIITVSDPIASYLRRFNPATQVIYNCPRNRDIPKLSKKEARTQLGLPLDDFIVSSVGTIRHDCRFDLLLAVARLTEGEKIRYVVVGEGPLAYELGEAAKKVNGNGFTVIPRVPRRKAFSYILASDLTWAVYRSSKESLNARMTLPWKLFESLACGVPPIVEAGAFQAVLVRNLHCALILGSDSPDDVSRLIVSLANDPNRYNKMSEAARTASSTLNFTWEAMSTMLIATYLRLGQPEHR